MQITQYLGSILVVASVAAGGPVNRQGRSPDASVGLQRSEQQSSANQSAIAETVQKRDPRGKLVGFRTVIPEEAEAYRQHSNRLVYYHNHNKLDGDQIGEGVYLSPNIGEYGWLATDWWCAIYADPPSAWDSTKKAWLPHYEVKHNKEGQLWFPDSHEVIDKHLKKEYGKEWSIENTVVFSRIAGQGSLIQAMIPKEIVEGTAIRFSTDCVPKAKEADVKRLIQDSGETLWWTWGIEGMSQWWDKQTSSSDNE